MRILGSLFQTKKEAAPRPTPICHVLSHAGQPLYFLQSFCRNKQTGIYDNWGYLARVSAEDMKLRGPEIILGDLQAFPSRDSDYRVATSNRTPEGKRDARSTRESMIVQISLERDGDLVLTPMAKCKRSAWTSLPDGSLRLKQPASAEALFEALTVAFERCSREQA